MSATEAPATLSATEIIVAGVESGSAWWQMAEWLKLGWIAPGEEVAVIRREGGTFGPLSSMSSDRTAEQQVAGNLALGAVEGYVVTRTGARKVSI